ncbi:MAG: helix-turn-helix domain-containing protein [Boseongicola sp. SB0675_bin_26]|nr:helix-turn-helix domain-containing protein [Boseongicola sp. SB0675_bin_26]
MAVLSTPTMIDNQRQPSVTVVAIKAAGDISRSRLDERQGGGIGAERRGARIPRGACPHKAPRSLSDRCRIVLPCAEGLRSREVAERTRVHARTVGKWRSRFAERRIEGLSDERRSGRPRTVTDDKVAEAGGRTLNTMPKDATHWPVRSMAGRTGVSRTTVHRTWSAFSLKPHRSETFRLSTDALFVDKEQDIVGPCMAPPDRAVVLRVDEKLQ